VRNCSGLFPPALAAREQAKQKSQTEKPNRKAKQKSQTEKPNRKAKQKSAAAGFCWAQKSGFLGQ
jgi:hypothetical protein